MTKQRMVGLPAGMWKPIGLHMGSTKVRLAQHILILVLKQSTVSFLSFHAEQNAGTSCMIQESSNSFISKGFCIQDVVTDRTASVNQIFGIY